MTDIVMIAGAFQGGWYFDPVIPSLEAAGYRAFGPTLPGLEPDYLPVTPVNLESHVSFLERFLDDLGSDDVVLVGHSYGGMVITGAAARSPHRISKLIYLDSPVPVDGDRVWDLIPVEARGGFVAACPDGYMVEPHPDLMVLEPRSIPHPVATFLQPLDAPTDTLTMPRTFAVAGNGSAFQSVYERLATEPEWETLTLPCGHDFVREAREDVTQLILDQVRALRSPSHAD